MGFWENFGPQGSEMERVWRGRGLWPRSQSVRGRYQGLCLFHLALGASTQDCPLVSACKGKAARGTPGPASCEARAHTGIEAGLRSCRYSRKFCGLILSCPPQPRGLGATADIEPTAEGFRQPAEYKGMSTWKLQAEGRQGVRPLRPAFLPGAPRHGKSSCWALALWPRTSPSGAVFLPLTCPHLCIVPAVTLPHGHGDGTGEVDVKCFFSGKTLHTS